jgi:hypothetical protein
MTQESWELAGDIAFTIMGAAAVTFTVLYLLLTPWWRTPTGRNIMAMMSTLAIIGAWGSYILLTDMDRPFAVYQIRFAMFLVLAIVIIWRIVIFVRVQLLARQSRKEILHHDLRT